MTTGLLVILGAMVGAPLRYLTDAAMQSRHTSRFPWGTLTVNIAGSWLLGFLTSYANRELASQQAMALLGTGFCGALTTYSTFSYETVRLIQDGETRQAAVYVATSAAAGFAAAACGALIAWLVWA